MVRHAANGPFASMPDQLINEVAINVAETDTPFYFEGGTFSLGSGPLTEQTFSAQDDGTDFASFSTQPSEAQGAGRQTGQLADGSGTVTEDGVASLQQVLVLTDPGTGATVMVGRVRLSEDDNSFGNGTELGDVFIFSGPIDPTVSYELTSINYSPGDGPANSYSYSGFSGGSVQSGVVCFTTGTRILTRSGEVPVEELKPGSLVQTVDNGLQPVLWIGSSPITRVALMHDARLKPVRIEAGVLGNQRTLMVSQQHRIAVGGQFIKAKHLPLVPGIKARIAHGVRSVTYYHVLLEKHEMLITNGVKAESLFLGPEARRIMGWRHPFPGIASGPGHFPKHQNLCRPQAKRHQLPAARRALDVASVF